MGFTFQWRFVCLLLYILCLHAAAIVFFARGFLLTRNELPVSSRCDDVFLADCPNIRRNKTTIDLEHFDYIPSSCDTSFHNGTDSLSDAHGRSSERNNWNRSKIAPKRSCSFPKNANHDDILRKLDMEEGRHSLAKSKRYCESATERIRRGCWTPPAIKRVVILVLDALRFDFVGPSSLFTKDPKPWMDRLEVLNRLADEEESGALIFKFLADPPTTSLQRLKGLTTGSLPTFIDVGNSFGAPAIVEDNLIHQLASNGKRILMMGDDTWLQLFPTQFAQAHPFPSFNVKDLHTVDNGVISNLFPALYRDDWDVLIGHFLGVDHVGHIFGVESPHMVEKLEQYNRVIEDVVSVLRNQSYSGGLHEDTLFLVMGDHGQTLNGDHGGGAPEEVETALFAMSTRQPPYSLPRILSPSCDFPSREKGICIRTFSQIDFAATLAALIGIPFPFGSIGQVNAELFALVAGTWPTSNSLESTGQNWLAYEWMENYYGVLCVNSWQVNRYFDMYAESALSGFPPSDLFHIRKLYNQAHSFMVNWSQLVGPPDAGLDPHEGMAILARGIDAYSRYLDAAATLARSKWTQFGNDMMAFGLVIFFSSFAVHIVALYQVGLFSCSGSQLDLEDCRKVFPAKEMVSGGFLFGVVFATGSMAVSLISLKLGKASSSLSTNQVGIITLGGCILGSAKSYVFYGSSSIKQVLGMLERWRHDPRGILAVLFVAVYTCSLLSNSYILKEGQMVTFFLASSGILDLRHSVQKKSKVLQALCFLGLNLILGCIGNINVLKETEAVTESPREGASSLTAVLKVSIIWRFFSTTFTVFVPLTVLGWFFVDRLWRSSLLQKRSCCWVLSFGLLLTYVTVSLHWLLDDLAKVQVVSFSETAVQMQMPRMIYLMAGVQTLVLLHFVKNIEGKSGKVQLKTVLEEVSVPLIGVLSGMILLLLGRRGPLIALIAGIEGWCLIDMQSASLMPGGLTGKLDYIQGFSARAIQWSLFAVQLFFCTGHRCSFDGLRYAAAFIGFDQFNIYLQGILLAVDTFGASHVLPVIGLALLVTQRHPGALKVPSNTSYSLQMSYAFLIYGLVRLTITIVSSICVTIQRRHLMVWGLFAPKFVFDAIGLLVSDIMLVSASYYFLLPFLR